MSTNPTGLGANIARQAAQAVSQKSNPNNPTSANPGQRADAFAKATAPTNSPAPVTTAVAAPGSAPAAPVSGTTAPAAGRTAPTQAPISAYPVAAFAITMANSGVVSQVVVNTIAEKDENKKKTNEAINKAKADAEKSSLASQSDTLAGEEAAKDGSTGGASGPGAAAA